MIRCTPTAALLVVLALTVGCCGTGLYDPMMYGGYGTYGYGACVPSGHGQCGHCDCDDDDGHDCGLDDAACCVAGGALGVAGRAAGLVGYGAYGLGRYLLCGDTGGCGLAAGGCGGAGCSACPPAACDPCCQPGVSDPFGSGIYGAPFSPTVPQPAFPMGEPVPPTYVTPAEPQAPTPAPPVPPESAMYHGPGFHSASWPHAMNSTMLPSYPGYPVFHGSEPPIVSDGPIEISPPIEVGQPILMVPGDSPMPPPAPGVQEAAALPTIQPSSYGPTTGAARQPPTVHKVAAQTQWSRGFEPPQNGK